MNKSQNGQKCTTQETDHVSLQKFSIQNSYQNRHDKKYPTRDYIFGHVGWGG